MLKKKNFFFNFFVKMKIFIKNKFKCRATDHFKSFSFCFLQKKKALNIHTIKIRITIKV